MWFHSAPLGKHPFLNTSVVFIPVECLFRGRSSFYYTCVLFRDTKTYRRGELYTKMLKVNFHSQYVIISSFVYQVFTISNMNAKGILIQWLLQKNCGNSFVLLNHLVRCHCVGVLEKSSLCIFKVLAFVLCAAMRCSWFKGGSSMPFWLYQQCKFKRSLRKILLLAYI